MWMTVASRVCPCLCADLSLCLAAISSAVHSWIDSIRSCRSLSSPTSTDPSRTHTPDSCLRFTMADPNAPVRLCLVTTANGQPCRNRAVDGSPFCNYPAHSNQAPPANPLNVGELAHALPEVDRLPCAACIQGPIHNPMPRCSRTTSTPASDFCT